MMTLIVDLTQFQLKVLFQGCVLSEIPLSGTDGKAKVEVNFASGVWPESVKTIFKEGEDI